MLAQALVFSLGNSQPYFHLYSSNFIVRILVLFILIICRCPQIRKPYLFCLHASPVTCIKLYENCNSEIYESLLEVSVTSPPPHEHTSLKQWPAMGGCVRSSEPSTFDILVTG